MQIENTRFLEICSQSDPVRHYNTCKDLTLAGEDYKVNAIAVFARDPADPLSNYVTVKTYDDELGFILVAVYTRDEALLTEAMDYTAAIGEKVQSIELRTPYPEILDSPALRRRFTVTDPEDGCMNPVYYVHTAAELVDFPPSAGVEIRLADDAERERARGLLSASDEAEYGLREGLLYLPDNFPDILQFILYLDGKPIGYLRGENGFGHIYDIGWVYVLPQFGGKGYGKQLTAWFSRYCFEHGLVPQYGFAINEASVAVAKACGYRCDTEKMTAKNLVMRKM